jgi:tetratricopeptide (TPR) repeat protein
VSRFISPCFRPIEVLRGFCPDVAAPAILLALVAATVVSCGRGAARDGARERAYRANNLGVADLEQFNYAGAALAFGRALQIDPSLAIARLNLSLALLYSQDEGGAERQATEAARLLPSEPRPHYILGLIARAGNRTAGALREFERVRQMDPGDVGTNINLGQIHLEQQQYPQAIARLQAAVAAEPSNLTAAYNLGLALTRSGRTTEGAAMLQRAQNLRASGYAITYGTGYLEQGRYAEAVASTGAEPDLVDPADPHVLFAPVTIAPAATDAAPAPTPFGRRFVASDLTEAGMRRIAAGLGGGLALLDFDGDGDLDLFDASPGGQRLLRNDGHGTWTDVTPGSGLGSVPPDAVPIGCVAGDFDNDGRPDLFVLRFGMSSLYHNDGGGHFTDVTSSAGIPSYPYLPGAAAFVDIDHDGDLDLVIAGLADLRASRERAGDRALAFPADFAPAPVRLLRNNGNGTFTDTTADAHLQAATHAVAIVPTDFDNRRDVDLLVVNRTEPPLLFKNLRDGTFRDVAVESGLVAAVGSGDEITAVTAADVNKDDFPDFFFAHARGGVFALSDGHDRFTAAPAPAGVRAALASQFVDYDGDGLLDLLTWSTDGPHLFRNSGRGWTDASRVSFPDATTGSPASPRGLLLADVDADGRTDVITGGLGALVFWRNGGSGDRRSLRVVLKGRVSNRLGVGSKIQVRAGSLSSRLETSAATPPVAPADIVFGLGRRPGADAVRVLWPSGIVQAEALSATLRPPLVVEELNRKPSSCPFLYTWNGARFEFVTDFMGAGEMGYLESPGVRNAPNPVEYVRIEGGQLQPRNGRYDLRVTNELEETLFVDRLKLFEIAHPPGIDVYPNGGMTDPPKPFDLFAVTGQRVPRAIDDDGRDVTDRVARIDWRYPDGFALDRFRGYAAQHTLRLDLAPVGNAPVLLLTGWTDYAFSSDNLAAHQAGLSLIPPMLQARNAAGDWRTIVADIGFPVGRPQTVTVDLTGRLRPAEHEVRIVTNMRIYWDRVLVATRLPAAATGRKGSGFPMRALDPITAALRVRGFSAAVQPDGQEPPRYDYEHASPASPWKTMPGRYTREGDVRALLTKADDMFVVAAPGDEIALSFDATAADALPGGWTRTFLLLADGFSKEMDINSASPDVVAPMPYHAMTAYPYHAPQHYPDTVEYQRYQAKYNTRVVSRSTPPLETLLSR